MYYSWYNSCVRSIKCYYEQQMPRLSPAVASIHPSEMFPPLQISYHMVTHSGLLLLLWSSSSICTVQLTWHSHEDFNHTSLLLTRTFHSDMSVEISFHLPINRNIEGLPFPHNIMFFKSGYEWKIQTSNTCKWNWKVWSISKGIQYKKSRIQKVPLKSFHPF